MSAGRRVPEVVHPLSGLGDGQFDDFLRMIGRMLWALPEKSYTVGHRRPCDTIRDYMSGREAAHDDAVLRAAHEFICDFVNLTSTEICLKWMPMALPDPEQAIKSDLPRVASRIGNEEAKRLAYERERERKKELKMDQWLRLAKRVRAEAAKPRRPEA
jgi:hypothetical protein